MLNDTLEAGRELTDAALERLLPPATQHPVSIHRAMHHSVFAGGKRLRPILCMESGRMIAESLPSGIENLGAALEMLHTYSLIHDDLPALDNDDLRRGRPLVTKYSVKRSQFWRGMHCKPRRMKLWRACAVRPKPECALSKKLLTAPGPSKA
jgi:geranylgeranyl pyrophosphate synthase